ncbi:HAMP domain-containing protein [Cerasibacillus terrae]|uniref:Heme sensor protein HssS n=1 Tax=Cerasibacillus terrae TaxID=2498845 RepID=A0A5C8NQP8_9BACI|nr:HAMP domain-containing sensor histidine kinase [Cerasibacillus terrae]TXL63642.1 HAMP domain-containing protein [Cerasibacillus terrae]
MRTLYVRIIMMTMVIMIGSAIIAFVVTNLYYHHSLKPKNDQKITKIAENVAEIYDESRFEDIRDYLSTLTVLGYQFYIVDDQGNGELLGAPFRKYNITKKDVEKVISGETYHGIRDNSWKLFVTGFFDNELKNTIGVPIQRKGEVLALFVRPNTVQQFGEMRFFLAVAVIVMLIVSFLLILTSTSFIVRPIKKLTEATKKIAAGNYHVKLNVKRRDEIGRLANDFSKMSDSLAKTEESRQEFVSNVSHEIQSPLTSIQGFSQALREEDLPEEMRHHYLSIIEKESKRLSALSKQLLTLSFLDRETDHKEKIPFDIAEQIKEAVSSTEWQWRQKEITIEMDISRSIIEGNPRLMQLVWINLITNAIRYTNNYGTIEIITMNDKQNVTILVKDTGIGISKQDIPHLFERFYKVDKARTRKDNSTGLGLSIVKKIIEIHRGTIMVESELGKGTVLQVTLPRE